jgi:RND family efflux transporter MFP subunit
MFSKTHILLFAGICALSACTRSPEVQAPIRAVKVLQVSNATLSTQSEFAADIQARVESRLGFQVGGKLIARHVESGQRVKSGQLLAEIEARDFRLSVDSARAQLNAAQTNRDLAAADFKRFKELRDKEFISGAELEHRESALKSAQAQLEQAQAALAAQGNQLGYSKLFADKAGVITGLDAEVGQVVSAGMPVVRLAHDGPRDVVFAVAEDQLGVIKAGQTVKVKLWGSNQWTQAKVHEISASADPVTRTFAVKAAIDDMKIALGSTATVVVNQTATGSNSITLPTTAVRQEAGKSSVWIVDPASMSVRSQPVQVGGVQDNMVIISSGLQPGQQVVTTGVHVLSPGQKVTYFKPGGEQP